MEDVNSDRINGRQMALNLPLRPRSCPRCRTTAKGIRKGRKGGGGTRANPSDKARAQARGKKKSKCRYRGRVGRKEMEKDVIRITECRRSYNRRKKNDLFSISGQADKLFSMKSYSQSEG